MLLWPDRRDGVSGLTRAVILIAGGTALLTLSAKISLPLPYVPMTLQTLVVLVLSAAYGWRLGAATVVVYLAEGAIGLPVFAGPVGGLEPLIGPTAGYLFGFVLAAIATGWLSERGWDRSVLAAFPGYGVGAHHHSCGWVCMACVWHQARHREGMAYRDCALYRCFRDKERTRSSGCAGDQASARSAGIKLRAD